jgi:hypothetical protein
MPAGIDFISLKYQAKPNLVIEECLKADDPINEVTFAIFALAVSGHRSMAEMVMDMCPRYGINIDFVEVDTRY